MSTKPDSSQIKFDNGTVQDVLDKFNNTFASFSYFINAANNDIANVPLDGVTDGLAAMQAIFAHIKTNNMRGVRVYVPNTGNPLLLSNALEISRGDFVLDLQCDVRLTKSVYAAGSSAIVVNPLIPADVPLRNFAIIGQSAAIDGNARNMTGLPVDGYDTVQKSDCVFIFGCANFLVKGIHAYNGVGFGVGVGFCQDFVLDDVEASYAAYENGIGINFFPYWQLDRDPVTNIPLYDTYDSEDPEWRCRGIVRNCRGHHNKDIGISSFCGNGVLFQDCLTWQNGNVGGYNAGGGYSAEGNHPYAIGKNLYINFERCYSFNDKNYGFYFDRGVQAIYDDCHVKGVTSTHGIDGSTPSGKAAIIAIPLRRASFWKGMSGEGATAVLNNCSGTGSDDAALILLGEGPSSAVNFVSSNLLVSGVAKQGMYSFRVGKFHLDSGRWEDVGGGTNAFTDNMFFINNPTGFESDIRLKKPVFKGVGSSYIGNCATVSIDVEYQSSGAYMQGKSYIDGIAVYDSGTAIAKNNVSIYAPVGAETFVPIRFYSTVAVGIMTNNDTTPRLPINQAASRPTDRSSTTANRPTGSALFDGLQWYDTTLDKPIWWNGSVWKDAAGTTV